MDVLEVRPQSQYHDELKKLIKLFQYHKTPLQLKGSASLASQRYPADYDLSCVLTHPDKAQFYDFIQELLVVIKGLPDIWFIELKLQTKQGKKVRVFPGMPFKRQEWDKVWSSLAFVKIDLVARIDGRFTEVSVMYNIGEGEEAGNYRKSLEDDIKELSKEGKWYKVLKRRFNLAKADKNKKELLRLSKIFNGEMGEEYQLLSTLEAVDKALVFAQDPQTIQKAVNQLKDLKLPPSINDIEGWMEERFADLNARAKKL